MTPPALDKKRKHDIEIVIDRLVIRGDPDELSTRLADSLETALGLTEGLAFADNADSGERTVFSANFACPESGTIDEIEPRLFSFNNPFGACPSCDGLGVSSHFDERWWFLTRARRCAVARVAPWSLSTSRYYIQTLESLARQFGFSLDTPFGDLDDDTKSIILHGSGKMPVTMEFDDGMRSYRTTKPFEGIMPNLARRYRETDSAWVREEMEKFRANHPCDGCGGKRLKAESLAVKIDMMDISDISRLSIGDARDWFSGLSEKLRGQ